MTSAPSTNPPAGPIHPLSPDSKPTQAGQPASRPQKRSSTTSKRTTNRGARELRKQINDLKKELSKASNIIAAKSQPAPDPAAIDAAYQRGRREGMQTIISELEPESELDRLEGVAESLQRGLAQLHTRRQFLDARKIDAVPVKYPKQPERIAQTHPAPQRPKERKL